MTFAKTLPIFALALFLFGCGDENGFSAEEIPVLPPLSGLDAFSEEQDARSAPAAHRTSFLQRIEISYRMPHKTESKFT